MAYKASADEGFDDDDDYIKSPQQNSSSFIRKRFLKLQ